MADTPSPGGGHGKPLTAQPKGPIDAVIHFCLTNPLVVGLVVLLVLLWGLMVSPFERKNDLLPHDPDSRYFSPVAVDAIPDIGENQQIIFTRWPGRSPQDVQDQITYPLTVSMLGLPGVKTVRSYSMFGFSTIYVIFDEDMEFYWTRSRILEKLNSLPAGSLPDEVQPALGPDATALGQVYWYTLEGRSPQGQVTGGWDLHELRSVQDWYVRYALLQADGIAEVASIGGFEQEYQIDLDPNALIAHGLTIDMVYKAVQQSNLDVGARTIEINQAEYVIRGVGYIKSLADIENTVITARDDVPLYVKNVATVSRGPAMRRGVLDKGGAEVVGGVAVVRYGDNPLAAIRSLQSRIDDLAPSLPRKVLVDFTQTDAAAVSAFAEAQGFQAFTDDGSLDADAWLAWWDQSDEATHPAWASLSQVTVVPFYDRSGLINETLGTLRTALVQEILVTIIVIIIMVMHLRSSLVISATLPLAVLICFIAMKVFGVDANVVALSGIAIAIGTIVDMGVIICENILRHLEEAPPEEARHTVVFRASSEVGGAVLTAILTTVISFLPVFALIGPEGKLFRPLAYTKTFALIASVMVALTIVPTVAALLFGVKIRRAWLRYTLLGLLAAGGIALGIIVAWRWGLILVVVAIWLAALPLLPERVAHWLRLSANYLLALAVGLLLTSNWLPLGPAAGFWANAVVVLIPIAVLLIGFRLFAEVYPTILRWVLDYKPLFMVVPVLIVFIGGMIWLGAPRLLGWLPDGARESRLYTSLETRFPGLGREFMPDLDEGSFLWMPTTMPHASIGESLDAMQKQDMAFTLIPEVIDAVGKIGRVDSPLDPAPVSMVETVVTYHSEYLTDPISGERLRFRFDADATDLARAPDGEPLLAPDGQPYTVRGAYERDDAGALIPDPDGSPFRLWRPALDPDLNDGRDAWAGVRSPDDIWQLIVDSGSIPGSTSATKLQPIAARIVMLQSGMRADMGIKIQGPDLESIEAAGLRIANILQTVPSVNSATVTPDRIVGKPYLEIAIDRQAAARHGIPVKRVQDVIEVAIGGRAITTTVEGRERYPVRIRYKRELRDSIDELGRILVPSGDQQHQIPMRQLADIQYVRGPQVIKSEDTFLTGYVTFGPQGEQALVDVIDDCRERLEHARENGELVLAPGVSYTFAGGYENQQRAARTFRIVLPVALFLIVLVLHLNFRRLSTTLLVFSGIVVAWSGGFMLVWLYGQPGFLDFAIFGQNLRELFQIDTVNLSVAVWVGFLALFGIASDDGVVIASYLDQSFADAEPDSVQGIRDATIAGASRRIRPCLMTSATTILALLPVLSSTGRGSDIMVPMAIPSFGGMLVVLITVFVVPCLYCWTREIGLHAKRLAAQADG